MLGYSKFNNNTFNGSMTGATDGRWSGFQMLRSEITDNTMNANNILWRDIWMSNAKIRNAVDIQIQDVKLKDIDLDLTGFTQDIISEQIETGAGFFTVNHNFATSPLTAGTKAIYNLIPIGAQLTELSISGTINGTNVAVGIDSDFENVVDVPVGLLPIQWGGVSGAATANRSLSIKAVGADITSGVLTIKVEFKV
jgi:hypothetical protein